ncbi:MAG: hypothetical protein AB7N53_04705 [Candidatus Binatia bacterium]
MRRARVTAALWLAALLIPLTALADLPAALQRDLENAKHVYISSTRKDGSLSRPAEIWFLWHDGAVYVGTPPTSWRVRRINAGRPGAKIAVGSVDGPSFRAAGSVVKDATIEALMMERFAQKYPAGWAQHADSFRSGFKDGRRVVVKYVPTP